MRAVIFLFAFALCGSACQAQEAQRLEALVARYAQLNGVPKTLVDRVIMRESRFNPRARGRSFWGLMQLRVATARSMGYRGRPEGLLDPETNLTYGVVYLANAWRVAGGDALRALRLYSSGYYYEAKRRGRLSLIRSAAQHADAGQPQAAVGASPDQGTAGQISAKR